MQVIQIIKQFLLHRSLISGSSDPGSGNRLRCSRNTYIKNQRNIRIIGSVSLILLLTLTAFTLRPVSVSTDFAEATANPATTTLTVETSGNAAILDITPSSTTGTFSSSDTTDTSLAFNVSTDNITGYNLSISHGSSTTPAPLVNEDLSTSSTTIALESLSSGTSITESEFGTSAYVGRYGYKPSMLNSEDNSNYIPAPTTSSTTLNKTSQANTTSDNYTIALGANIDYTKSAGTYTNTFILTAVANNVPYRINYLDDTSDSTVAGLPTAEASSEATASSFTLSDTTPVRTGYDFIGWCDGTVTHNSAGTDTCTGTTYLAGDTYSFSTPSVTSTNVANLYAMWNVKTFIITLAKTNATAIVIDGTSYSGSSATLTYGTHTISGTYASGYEFSSWATSNSTNLAISSTSSASTSITVHGAATLTLNDKSKTYIQDFTASMCSTQASSSAVTVYDRRDEQAYTVRYINGNCWMTRNLAIGCNGSGSTYGSSVSSKSLTSTDSNVSSSWSTPTAGLSNGNSSADAYMTCSSSYGAWYNYAAASAGTITGGSTDATYSICPKGWALPTNSQFYGITSYSSSFSPVSGGYYLSGSLQGTGYGGWWSATANHAYDRYILYWTSSSLSPGNFFDRYYGFYVRCVLKPTIENVTYMQDVTSEMVANTTVGATATLIDKRDNQSYLVGKLADGKLWMLDNLRLGSATLVEALSTSNTNMSSSVAFTLPTSSSSGFTSYNTAMINTDYANTTTTSYGSGSGKIGVYYNYCAASAGTYCYASGSGSNASYDVCPAGWRMPTGRPSGEYQALCDKIKGSSCSYSWLDNQQAFRAALSTPLSGYFYGSSVYDRGGNGHFWSSTYNAGLSMYSLLVNSSYVNPQDHGDRRSGYSVRCVLK